MSGSYIEVIKEGLPQATLVFDKFHIVRYLLQAVDALRKEEARALKKTDKQRARLGYLDKLNLRCHRAHLLKESFREFWKYKTRGWARRFLTKWFWWATHARFRLDAAPSPGRHPQLL